MNHRLTTTIATTAAIAAFLILLPAETGLSFADDNGGSISATPTNDQKSSDPSSSGQQQTSDQPSSTPTPDQPQQPQGVPTNPPQQPEGKPVPICNDTPQNCGPNWKPWPRHLCITSPWCPIKIIQPTKVIVHHTTTTKTVHDRSLTIPQQNCVYGALQLGFNSNAQNRVDATYAAILGCFG